MRDRIAFASWVSAQASALRKPGFQVADKAVARVLLELHNKGTFDAGLVPVGTLAFMAWLNELGAMAVAARTQDVDPARRRPLKLAAPLSFLATPQAIGVPFVSVPGLPSTHASTSVNLPGIQGLRVDVLAPGDVLGTVVKVPGLEWAAQAVPGYDYLLESPEPGAVPAGGHCIPVRLPQAARMVWHKLYASLHRRGFPEKSVKDRQRALILAAVLADVEPAALPAAFGAMPGVMAAEVGPLAAALAGHAGAYPVLREALRSCSSWWSGRVRRAR